MLAMLATVTAVVSALLDNVTTVLLVVPVTLVITEELEVNPYPFLFFADLRVEHRRHGDADRRSAEHHDRHGQAGLSFNDFVGNLTPVIVVILVSTLLSDPPDVGPPPPDRRGDGARSWSSTSGRPSPTTGS